MRQVLKRPVVSEKSTMMSERGQYVFEVSPDANKIEIRKAIESRYNVRVASVRTINVKPKTKVQWTRRGFMMGKTNLRKKAIVSLAHGQTLDIYEELSAGDTE